MIEGIVTDMVKERIMDEIGAYVFVGCITILMMVSYVITNKIEAAVEKRRR